MDGDRRRPAPHGSQRHGPSAGSSPRGEQGHLDRDVTLRVAAARHMLTAAARGGQRHGVEIGWRTADDAEDLRGRRLPLQRFAQLAGGRLFPLQRFAQLSGELCDRLFIARRGSCRARAAAGMLSRAPLRLGAGRSTSGHHCTRPATRYPEVNTSERSVSHPKRSATLDWPGLGGVGATGTARDHATHTESITWAIVELSGARSL